MKKNWFKYLLGIMLALNIMAPLAASADPQAPNPGGKITICHRSGSVTNPYVTETINFSSTDGSLIDPGNGDHTQHLGPVVTSQAAAQALKDHKQNWGDIIPPYSWNTGSFPGLNWATDGQVVYSNGCNYVAPVSVVYVLGDCSFTNGQSLTPVTVTIDPVGGATTTLYDSGNNEVHTFTTTETISVSPGSYNYTIAPAAGYFLGADISQTGTLTAGTCSPV